MSHWGNQPQQQTYQQTQQKQQQQYQQTQQTQQQSFSNQNQFKKRGEQDEDTLSLDSQRSQGYINQPVDNWPAWSIGQTQNTQAPSYYSQPMQPPIFYRGPPVTYQPQQNLTQPQQSSYTNNQNYAQQNIPNYNLFNRGPVFHKKQQPQNNYNYMPMNRSLMPPFVPQQQQQQISREPIQIKGKKKQ